jgi:N,N'-diacetylbacillosaminyl-diphospho-undecaprenol alpha-1,3-N-acetylgalactosaminyltransferase
VKIAIVCSYDYSAWCLGIFLKKLKLEHDVTVISDIHNNFEYGHYVNKVKGWGINHELVRTYRFMSPYEDIKYLFSLYKAIKRGKYDMVINVATKPNVYGSIASRMAKVDKIVCFGWGLGLTFEKSRNLIRLITKYILSVLYWYAFKVSTKVWFTNKDDIDYFVSKKILKSEKAFLTRGFVNTNQYSPAAVTKKTSDKLKTDLGYQLEDKVVIMIARMSWAKGVKYFCEASDILREEYSDVKFLLVGMEDTGSPDSVPIEYLKNYNEKENFNWLGFRVDIEELYSISYMAVFPSYYREGGWPRGVTEPMSMGKPVITTDTISCSNAVENGVNGLLVPPKDSFALSKAIEVILNDETLASKFGKKSREKAVLENDEELIMSQLINAII